MQKIIKTMIRKDFEKASKPVLSSKINKKNKITVRTAKMNPPEKRSLVNPTKPYPTPTSAIASSSFIDPNPLPKKKKEKLLENDVSICLDVFDLPIVAPPFLDVAFS